MTFEPGARTAWHTHPLGQTLIVTAGSGRVQREGGPIEEIRPGDVVWFPPGEKHWHGAGPTTAMSHIAIQEKLNGSPVDWMKRSRKSNTEATDLPHVFVKLWPKPEAQKQKLADAITTALREHLGYGADAASVSMEEIAPANWDEKVYQPDIVNGLGKLYKAPGYGNLRRTRS